MLNDFIFEIMQLTQVTLSGTIQSMVIALASFFSPVSFGPSSAYARPSRSLDEKLALALPHLLTPSRVSFSWAW